MGLELQLEELIEQKERARVQARLDDARRIELEIQTVQTELAATAEILATHGPDPDPPPEMHNAAQLNEG